MFTTLFLWLCLIVYVLLLDYMLCSFLHSLTCYLYGSNLTLFVVTKWAEWQDLLFHDGLRGKIVYLSAGLLSSFELRHLFHLVWRFNIATKTYLKSTQYLDLWYYTYCLLLRSLTNSYYKENHYFHYLFNIVKLSMLYFHYVFIF